ncbi:MAG: TonB-dependent siderophore receptor [Agriterribacter sp.]
MRHFISSVFFISTFFSLQPFLGNAQESTGSIKGTVLTSDNQPGAYVTVTLKGTKRITNTDENGKFAFNRLLSASYNIVISVVGYQTVEQNITVTAGKASEISIQIHATEKELEEVVIVGGRNKFAKKETEFVARMPLKNLENPQVYSVISKEITQEQVATTMEQTLKNAPGISSVAAGPGGGGSSVAFVSRGFVTNYTSTRNGLTAGSVTLVDPVNIERLEVIKGPSSTLFGSSVISHGGLVNIVTKQPFNTYKGEVAYTTGSFGFNRLTADINAPLNNDKTALIRVNAAGEWQDGFQDYGKQSLVNVAPSFLYHVNDKLTLRLDAEFFSTSRPIVLYAPWGGAGVSNWSELNINPRHSFIHEGFNSIQRTSNVFARADYKISDKWTSQTNYSYTSGNNHTQYLFLNIEPSQDGGHYVARENYDVRGSLNTLDIQQNFIGDFKIGNARNRLLVGVDYTRFKGSSVRRDAYFDTVDIHYETVTPINTGKVEQLLSESSVGHYPYAENIYSAYASNVLNVTDRLLAMMSLRVDKFVSVGDYNQTALSPKFGIVYQLVKDQVSVFGNYMNGFQNVSGEDYNKNKFKPQQANQVEGGVKVELLDHKLNATISYYDILVKDILRNDPEHATFSIQDGTQRSKGFELDIITNPITGLNIVAGYAYNDNKYVKADDYLVGKRGLNTPRHVANFWASYKIVNGAVRGLGIGIGGNYADKSFLMDDANSTIIDGYTVLDATLFFDQPKWRVGLKVNNIADKRYWVANYYPVPQAPRQILASIAYRF